MRYADSLLTTGEVLVLRTRQHWLQLVKRSRYGLLLWLVGIILIGLVIWFNITGAVQTVLSWSALVALLAGLVVFLWALWHWWAQDYMVTNRRLLKVTGVLNKHSADSSLEMINDAVLSQSLWGRVFNYGDLEIMTAAEEAVDYYHMIAGPVLFKKTMLTQKHALETELRSGLPPTPPLRATDPDQGQRIQAPGPAPVPMPAPSTVSAPPPPPPSAAAPAPAEPVAAPGEPALASAAAGGAPATVPPPGDNSLEITQTLARLADLRDKGAITPSEYEQKKTELLGRL